MSWLESLFEQDKEEIREKEGHRGIQRAQECAQAQRNVEELILLTNLANQIVRKRPVGGSSSDLKRAALEANGKCSGQSVTFVSKDTIITANNPLTNKFGFPTTVVTRITQGQMDGQIVIEKGPNGRVNGYYEVGQDRQLNPIKDLSDAIPTPTPLPKEAGNGFVKYLKRQGKIPR